jgi:ParB family chromosome partitioning protein
MKDGSKIRKIAFVGDHLPGGEAGFYELVTGARLYRASKLAGQETIPATVRELTDTQCLELQLIENLQRTDVHELDEARGYAALMQLQPENYTVEVLAEKIGRSEKYVYARLRLILPSDTAGACGASQGTARRTHREADPRPHSGRDSQEASRVAVASRP